MLLASALVTGGLWRLRSRHPPDDAPLPVPGPLAASTAAGTAFATDVAIPVSGAAAVRDTLVVSVTAAAQAAPVRQAVLRAQVDGQVQRVLVRESQRVGEGELLLEIDASQYRLELERARAALAKAEAAYHELTLFDENLADSAVRAQRARVARAKSGLAEAEVGLREAELRLERTRLVAPFSGRVANLRLVPGQWVRSGDELITVLDLDPIRLEAQVLESEVGLLAAGRGAQAHFAAFPGETFHGRISTINPVVDQQSRTARVTVTLANPGARILPGMYAQVSLEARRFPDRILVPRAAILERDRRTMLFVFAGEGDVGLAKWRYVTTGLANDSLVEIVPNPETSMVEPGEIVLVEGHSSLIHDATVRLVGNLRAFGGRPR
jgi:HlyD family secretion protein